MKKRLFCCLLVVMMSLGVLPVCETQAVTTMCQTYSGKNVEAQNYSRWSSTIKSYLTTCDDGSLMRVQYGAKIEGLLVEYYDAAYNIKNYRMIPAELPLFGGFYEADNYYFVVTGQTNKEESAETEVFRITKYDKKWNRIKSVGLNDCNTTIPFDAGSLRMVTCGKYLLIRTSHEMYTSTDGYNHQANVTIELNMETMEITDSYTKVMNSRYGYVSHSFNQFIQVENNRIVAVDHGDAHPRSIALLKYQTDASTGTFVPGYYTPCTVTDVMQFPGTSGNNTTGAAIGGFEISDTKYLVAGHSVVQDATNTSRTTRNIFIAAVDKQTSEVTTNWMTSYEEGDGTTSTPQMVKIEDNRYILLWSRAGQVYYTEIDGAGNLKGKIYSYAGSLSDCVPTVSDGKLIWYTWNENVITFYDIELNNLAQASSTEIVNGHHYENHGVSDGVATLRCNICQEETQMQVATSISVWWNSDGGNSYSSGFSRTQEVGNQLYCWITYSPSGVNSEMEIVSSDSKVISVEKTNSNHGVLTMNKGGKATITVFPKWNPELKRSYAITVNAPLEGGIIIHGCQISTTVEGMRTLYSVESEIQGKKVANVGMVYSLAAYADEEDLYVGSDNPYVRSYQATDKGISSIGLSDSPTAKSYAMTMKFGPKTAKEYNAKWRVKAYAQLSDGSYVYTDAVTYSIYMIADKLYQDGAYPTKAEHDYLYTDILSVAHPGYQQKAFDRRSYVS